MDATSQISSESESAELNDYVENVLDYELLSKEETQEIERFSKDHIELQKTLRKAKDHWQKQMSITIRALLKEESKGLAVSLGHARKAGLQKLKLRHLVQVRLKLAKEKDKRKGKSRSDKDSALAAGELPESLPAETSRKERGPSPIREGISSRHCHSTSKRLSRSEGRNISKIPCESCTRESLICEVFPGKLRACKKCYERRRACTLLD